MGKPCRGGGWRIFWSLFVIAVFVDAQKGRLAICKGGVHFCFEPLTCFRDGGRGDPQQDGLLGNGELQVREDIGTDIALCQIGMRFPERFGRKVA